jgi:hypothetical protein
MVGVRFPAGAEAFLFPTASKRGLEPTERAAEFKFRD